MAPVSGWFVVVAGFWSSTKQKVTLFAHNILPKAESNEWHCPHPRTRHTNHLMGCAPLLWPVFYSHQTPEPDSCAANRGAWPVTHRHNKSILWQQRMSPFSNFWTDSDVTSDWTPESLHKTFWRCLLSRARATGNSNPRRPHCLRSADSCFCCWILPCRPCRCQTWGCLMGLGAGLPIEPICLAFNW